MYTSMLGLRLCQAQHHLHCCLQDPNDLTNSNAAAGGLATGQIMFDAFKARYGTGIGGSIAMIIFVVATIL